LKAVQQESSENAKSKQMPEVLRMVPFSPRARSNHGNDSYPTEKERITGEATCAGPLSPQYKGFTEFFESRWDSSCADLIVKSIPDLE
jgi:hypothetical protein